MHKGDKLIVRTNVMPILKRQIRLDDDHAHQFLTMRLCGININVTKGKKLAQAKRAFRILMKVSCWGRFRSHC